MTSNRKLGNDFESEFCEILAEHGFWVHNFALKKSGQPADIIAIKKRMPFLIDCKVCENDRFPFSRIEENQRLSMELWEDCGNGQGWFALKTSMGIYMVPLTIMTHPHPFKESLSKFEIEELTMSLEEWLCVIG